MFFNEIVLLEDRGNTAGLLKTWTMALLQTLFKSSQLILSNMTLLKGPLPTYVSFDVASSA